MPGFDQNLDFFGLLRPSVGSQLVRRMPILDLVIATLGNSNLFNVYVGYTQPIQNQSTTIWLIPQNPSWQGPGTLMLWDPTQNNGNGGYMPANPTLLAIMLAAMVPHTSGIWINQQVFKLVGTAIYTPTLGTNFVRVRVLGGGGGGAGCATTTSTQVSAGGGGGAGGYAEKIIHSGFGGVTVTVGAAGTGGSGGATPVIGTAGGTSSFGSFVSATGGGTAAPGSAVTPPNASGNGGSAGAGSNGDVNGGGATGSGGIGIGVSVAEAGFGGSLSPYGTGGRGLYTGTSYPGPSASGYGSGGAGGMCGASQTGVPGGNGTQGLVIVDEYV